MIGGTLLGSREPLPEGTGGWGLPPTQLGCSSPLLQESPQVSWSLQILFFF